MSQVVSEAEAHHREEQNLRKLGSRIRIPRSKRSFCEQAKIPVPVLEKKSRNLVRFIVAVGENPQCGPCCSSRRRATAKMRGPPEL